MRLQRSLMWQIQAKNPMGFRWSVDIGHFAGKNSLRGRYVFLVSCECSTTTFSPELLPQERTRSDHSRRGPPTYLLHHGRSHSHSDLLAPESAYTLEQNSTTTITSRPYTDKRTKVLSGSSNSHIQSPLYRYSHRAEVRPSLSSGWQVKLRRCSAQGSFCVISHHN